MTNTTFTPLSAPGTARTSRSELARLSIVLLLGLVLRLSVIRMPGYTADVSLFAEWADGLLKIPWDEYYGLVSPWCDYVPGYLYVLAAAGWLKTLLTGSVLPIQDFEPWIKAINIIADLALAATVYSFARRFTSAGRSLLAASLIVLNPSILFVGSIWGQAESIATLPYLLALLALASGSPVLAGVWAGLGFATKPQYAVFLIPAGFAYLRWVASRGSDRSTSPTPEGRLGWYSRRVLAPVAALVGSVQLLIMPFSTSLWPSPASDWTFLERVGMAVSETGGFASAGAFNLWGTQIAGIRRLDSTLGWFSLTHETWGYVLFGAVVAISVAVAWRRSESPEPVLWACFFLAFGFFEVLTMMHERYLFLAVVLSATIAAFRPWVAAYCAALSALFGVNLWYIWAHGADLFANLRLTQWASDAGVLLFVVGLVAVAAAGTRPGRHSLPGIGLWDDNVTAAPEWTRRLLHPAVSRIPARRVNLAAGTALIAAGLVLAAGVAIGRYVEDTNARARSPFTSATVRAYRANWQDTGVVVGAGDRVTIIAQGKWDHKHEGDLYGPAGNGDIPDWTILPSAPTGALLGKIGNSRPFLIGESLTLTAAESGPLSFVMNDGRKGYDDNRGRVQVIVAVVKP